MERVGTLINKLKEQLEQGAEPASLLVNARLLVSELQSLEQQQQPATLNGRPKVSVFIPSFSGMVGQQDLPPVPETPVPTPPVQQAKEPELLLPQETASAEEEEISAPEPVSHEDLVDSNWLFNMPADIPTLSLQPEQQPDAKEVFELNELLVAQHDRGEINERLRDNRVEVASVLQGTPVRDLRKAIGINDRYLFVNELFRGDESMYERSLKTINAFSIYPEAQYWIERELKVKMGWKDTCETAKLFDQIVKRRFS
jgi:hypothetical protein